MIEKYFNNTFTQKALYTEKEEIIRNNYLELEQKVLNYFDQYQFNRGLEDIFEYINLLNRYIVDAQPWNLAKTQESLPRLEGVLKTLARAILSVNTLLSPVLTDTAAKVRRIFNHGSEELGWKNLPEIFAIGQGEQLFPRGDSKVFFSEIPQGDVAPEEDATQGVGPAAPQRDAAQWVGPAAPQGDAAQWVGPAAETAPSLPIVQDAVSANIIEIEDFKKVQMVVALVLEAEKVEKADKLLKLKIDTGEGTRTLVAGIALFYKPENLIGRKIIIVKNLKPVKLRGILSQGMILAASDANNRPYIPFLPDDTPIGAILK
jgi:methionyl-tRNA synthetase